MDSPVLEWQAGNCARWRDFRAGEDSEALNVDVGCRDKRRVLAMAASSAAQWKELGGTPGYPVLNMPALFLAACQGLWIRRPTWMCCRNNQDYSGNNMLSRPEELSGSRL